MHLRQPPARQARPLPAPAGLRARARRALLRVSRPRAAARAVTLARARARVPARPAALIRPRPATRHSLASQRASCRAQSVRAADTAAARLARGRCRRVAGAKGGVLRPGGPDAGPHRRRARPSVPKRVRQRGRPRVECFKCGALEALPNTSRTHDPRHTCG